MKKASFILLTIAAMLGVMSCNKKAADITADQQRELDGRIRVHIGTVEETKGVYTQDTNLDLDRKIVSIQVFVFDGIAGTSKFETDYYIDNVNATGQKDVEFATFTGQKTVYAVVNHAREYLPKDYLLSKFEEEKLSDLSENTQSADGRISKLVMSGKNTVTVNPYNKTGSGSDTPDPVTIFVKRLSSMVWLKQVSVDFTKTSLAGAEFTIMDIYLKNVVGKCRLGMSAVSGVMDSAAAPYDLTDDQFGNYSGNWYNKNTKQATGAPAVTYWAVNKTATSVAGGATELNNFLMAYPNKTPDGTDAHTDEFSARHTRLVIHAKVKKADVTSASGDETYYVFDLPKLDANKIYTITDIKITMLGKDDDNKDEDIQQGRINPNIKVDNWGNASLSYDF